MIESIIIFITVLFIIYWLVVNDKEEREDIRELYD